MKIGVHVRPETPADHPAIHHVTRRAFEGHPYSDGTEPDIVDALRAADALAVSLVAEYEREVVGHVAFSPATTSDGKSGWYTLGPVSVVPEVQRRGIGGALITAGISILREHAAAGCIVLGDTAYYSRFGFLNAPDVVPPGEPGEHFMVLRLGASEPTGAFRFHEAFYPGRT